MKPGHQFGYHGFAIGRAGFSGVHTEDAIKSKKITIEAPVELVWQVLVDFGNYAAWNSFCPSAQAQLEAGSPIVMQTWLGDRLIDQTEYICRIEPPFTIAWRMENKPGDPIHATRTQYLEKLDDCRCTYLSVDQFSGEGVAAMMETAGKLVEDGFNTCARDLKTYCEARWPAQKT